MWFISFGLYVLIFAQVNGDNTSCNNCACCIEGKCTQEGNNHTCDYGCLDGHWGKDCMSDCPPSCKYCRSSGTCRLCKEGFMSSNCSVPCPSNCVSCSSSTSCSKCKDGYYRGYYNNDYYLDSYNDCRLHCRENCTTCESYSSCYTCNSGQYGTYCEKPCPNCFNKTCVKSTGRCSEGCASGITGDKCDQCVSGMYGTACQLSCSLGCLANTCERSDGACTDGCYIGFKGRWCSEDDDSNLSNDARVSVAVGGAVGVVGMLIGGVCILVVLKYLRNRRKPTTSAKDEKAEVGGVQNAALSDITKEVEEQNDNEIVEQEQDDYENAGVNDQSVFFRTGNDCE